MSVGGILKDNIKVFLPVLGLLFVIIAFYTLNLESYLFTDLTFNNKDKVENLSPPAMSLEDEVDYKARVRTDHGNFTIDLLENSSPENVNNFIFLAEKGFYNNLPFHRVIENFTIQTGDPVGDGYGNAGYHIVDERNTLKFTSYTVAMANDGTPHNNSSQFFITLPGGDFKHLDGEYTIIGKVVDGFDVVEKIGSVKVDANYVPKKKVSVKGIEIIKERK